MKVERWDAIYRITAELSKKADDFSVYEELNNYLLPKALSLNKSHFTLFDVNGSVFKEFIYGFTKEDMMLLTERGLIEDTKTDLLTSGRVVIVSDTQTDLRADKDIARDLDVGSYANIMFKAYQDEKPAGYMHLCKSLKSIKSGRIRKFTEKDIPFLGSVGGTIAIALKQRELIERLSYESLTDGLTKLPNMRSFYRTLDQKIQEAKETEEPLSVMMSDIDNFKYFVDTYGHLQGSSLIKELGFLLKNNIKYEHVVSNYAGDEFIFLLPNTKKQEAKQLSDTLRSVIEEYSFPTIERETKQETTYRITCSFGIAQLDSLLTGSDLIRRADDALDKAKKSGKNASVIN